MKKIVIFAFRGDPMCFIHVLLNGIEFHKRGMGGEIIIEGDAVKLVPEMAKEGNFLNPLYKKAKELGIIAGACKACSNKLKVAAQIEKENIDLVGEMAAHPAMADYIEKGYEIITF